MFFTTYIILANIQKHSYTSCNVYTTKLENKTSIARMVRYKFVYSIAITTLITLAEFERMSSIIVLQQKYIT